MEFYPKSKAKRKHFSDHRYLLINIEQPCQEDSNQSIPICITKIDKINDFVKEVDLSNISFKVAHDLICNEIKKNQILINPKRKKESNFRKPWFTNELKEMIRKRNKLYKIKLKYPSNEIYKTNFKNIKNLITKKIIEQKKVIILTILLDI